MAQDKKTYRKYEKYEGVYDSILLTFKICYLMNLTCRLSFPQLYRWEIFGVILQIKNKDEGNCFDCFPTGRKNAEEKLFRIFATQHYCNI